MNRWVEKASVRECVGACGPAPPVQCSVQVVHVHVALVAVPAVAAPLVEGESAPSVGLAQLEEHEADAEEDAEGAQAAKEAKKEAAKALAEAQEAQRARQQELDEAEANVRRYRELALLVHPDKCEHARAAEAFAVLTRCYKAILFE